MTKIVKRTLSDSPPNGKITARRKRRLAKLAARPDRAIDFSDLPERCHPAERSEGSQLIRTLTRPRIQIALFLRLGADVIAWLRKQGRGYQTRANSLLRSAMLRDLHQKAS